MNSEAHHDRHRHSISSDDEQPENKSMIAPPAKANGSVGTCPRVSASHTVTVPTSTSSSSGNGSRWR